MTVWHPAWGELRARLVIERRRRLAWRELEVRLVTERRLERAPIAAVLGGWRASRGLLQGHRAAGVCPL